MTVSADVFGKIFYYEFDKNPAFSVSPKYTLTFFGNTLVIQLLASKFTIHSYSFRFVHLRLLLLSLLLPCPITMEIALQ